MGCLKCGREITEGKVFCDDCLTQMEQFPVPPGVAIQLPQRRSDPPRRTVKRRSPPLEEQVKRLRSRARTLTVLLLLALILCGVMGYFTVSTLLKDRLPTGQNYSIIPSTSEVTENVSRETSQREP